MKNEAHKILLVTFYSFVSYKILIEVYINHKSNIVETLGYNFDVLGPFILGEKYYLNSIHSFLSPTFLIVSSMKYNNCVACCYLTKCTPCL